LITYSPGSGRMSRFDGARQGVGVWVMGFVVTLVAAVLGGKAGERYHRKVDRTITGDRGL